MCQVTGFYICISTRKKKNLIHPPSVVLHVQYDGFVFFAVYSLMYRCVWMWTAFLHFETKCICGKTAFSHRTHNWLIYWVLCISVRTCLCVCEFGALCIIMECHERMSLLFTDNGWLLWCPHTHTYVLSTHTNACFRYKFHEQAKICTGVNVVHTHTLL